MELDSEEKKKKPKRTHVRIQWLRNTLLTTGLILLAGVAAFSIAMGSYYYSSVSTGLEKTVVSAVGFLGKYNQSEYRAAVSSYVSGFEDKNRLELQFLSRYGSVEQSTSGLTAGIYPGTADINEAVTSGTISTWIGQDPNTSERIMAVSAPVIYNGTIVGIMRVVTSTALITRQILLMILIALAVAVGIMAVICLINLIFVRTIIVDPVVRITETAEQIAGGSYGIQIENTNNNEIGDLTNAFNDMSNKLSQAEKTQMEFISSVSHELRTPLTAITGWAETIMNGEVQDAQDVKKGMGIIVSEGRRLSSMVEELLEFSHIAGSEFKISAEPMDLKAELEDAVYTYREFFRQSGVTLNYEDRIPDDDMPLINGDPQRIRQVFSNLLDNAFKHGGTEGKQIDVILQREGNFAEVIVRDYGPGIPESELPYVKYKFYKGSSNARGSGIGLAVCDEIMSLHGGELIIQNAEGGGCQAMVRFPIETE
ncbi:MAG: HAMP domain-containing histidine kinase [Oscillospiraceae bacterium]|nr:HAMP domain-containing histidine kinase [Oscillospiraceae bacterium]